MTSIYIHKLILSPFFLHRFGYNCTDSLKSSVYCLSSGELIYFVAGVIVIWDPDRDTQRFYCEHLRDVSGCVPLCVTSRLTNLASHRLCVFDGKIVASLEQRQAIQSESSVRVRIWTAATLVTETTFEESLGDQKLIDMLFAPNVR